MRNFIYKRVNVSCVYESDDIFEVYLEHSQLRLSIFKMQKHLNFVTDT